MSGTGREDAVEAWKRRWSVVLCCNDCSTVYEVNPDTLSVSLQQTRPFTRMVVLPVPEGCPKCRNLKVAEEPKRG